VISCRDVILGLGPRLSLRNDKTRVLGLGLEPPVLIPVLGLEA